jgi:hypothetical protein
MEACLVPKIQKSCPTQKNFGLTPKILGNKPGLMLTNKVLGFSLKATVLQQLLPNFSHNLLCKKQQLAVKELKRTGVNLLPLN